MLIHRLTVARPQAHDSSSTGSRLLIHRLTTNHPQANEKKYRNPTEIAIFYIELLKTMKYGKQQEQVAWNNP